jgi:hypothetical protein
MIATTQRLILYSISRPSAPWRSVAVPVHAPHPAFETVPVKQPSVRPALACVERSLNTEYSYAKLAVETDHGCDGTIDGPPVKGFVNTSL